MSGAGRRQIPGLRWKWKVDYTEGNMTKSFSSRAIHRETRDPYPVYDGEVAAASAWSPPRDVLCIIPARWGSKGIPQKNIALLAGKPLMAYTIDVALRTPEITRVIVSTDDARIAETAREYGAEAPFLRPKDLGDDNSVVCSVVDNLLGTLARTEHYRPQAYVTLYPTSPLRSVSLISFLTRKLFQGYLEIIAAKPLRPATRYFHGADGSLSALEPPCQEGERFRPYGYFYAARTDNKGERRRYVHMLDTPEAFVDVDTPADLEQADRILTRGLFSFA